MTTEEENGEKPYKDSVMGRKIGCFPVVHPMSASKGRHSAALYAL